MYLICVSRTWNAALWSLEDETEMSKQQCFPVHLSTEPQRDIFTTRTVTQGLCFFNCAMDTHTHIHTHREREWESPSSTPPASLLFPAPLSRSALHQQQLGSAAYHFRARHWRGQGGQSGPCVGHPVWRGNERILQLTLNPFSLPLLLSSPRAASGETAELLLSCHPGTDDKTGLFTGRRDPGHGTHTYGRQEWKEGISFSSLPFNSLPPLWQQLLPLLQFTGRGERGRMWEGNC